MPGRIPWIERKFHFAFPTDYYPEILERLRGTPPRVEDRVKGLHTEVLTAREDQAWSIQEHVGHLLDVESLFWGRLDDFDKGTDTLRGADMTNRRTEEACHNEVPMDTILLALRRERAKFMERLDKLPPEAFGRQSLHPRLNTPMRLVDSVFFHTEHDDYHLARITELMKARA